MLTISTFSSGRNNATWFSNKCPRYCLLLLHGKSFFQFNVNPLLNKCIDHECQKSGLRYPPRLWILCIQDPILEIPPSPQKKKHMHVDVNFSNSDCIKYCLISFCNLAISFQFLTTSPAIFCPCYECRKNVILLFAPSSKKKILQRATLSANYQNVFFKCPEQRDVYFYIVGVGGWKDFKFKLNNSSFAVTKWNNYFTGICGPWTMPNECSSGCLLWSIFAMNSAFRNRSCQIQILTLAVPLCRFPFV